MIINHNLSAINANNRLHFTDIQTTKSMEKLASGIRINRAGDDASGLAVSEKMRSQIRGLNQAQRNSENGISFIQTAEGYLQESQDVIQRMRELAIQAANGIYSAEDRMMIQIEVSQLVDEVDRVASHAQFNGMNMLTGRFGNPLIGGVIQGSMWFHIGANMDQRERVFIGTMSAKGLGLRNLSSNEIITISTPESANMSIGMLDKALMKINKQRADLGGYQNRLEYTAQGLAIASENLQAAESVIRDTNMASAMVEYVKNSILLQSGNAMLAQANQKPQTVLQLLNA
ncbi:MAG: flagellin [Spirochaetes bacterium]|nr:flagellin [Spirochaetota bacterium]